jgi:hypothetical protein
MFTFIIDSTPILHICSFCKGHEHVIRICFYRPNQKPIFVMEPTFNATQPTILVNSQILVIHIHVVHECMMHPQAPWWIQLRIQRWRQWKEKELGRAPWLVAFRG